MYDLGAFPGAVNLVGWCVLNAYGAIVLGNFRNSYPGCHSIVDMVHLAGGRWGPLMREIVGVMFILAYVIVASSGIIGVSAAFNALSRHAMCTVYWSLVSTAIVALFASVRKFAHVGWLTWVGFFSVFAAVFIIVYASFPPPPLPPQSTQRRQFTQQTGRQTDQLSQNRRHNPRSTGRSPPNRALRSRLSRHWQSHLRRRHHRLRNNLLL